MTHLITSKHLKIYKNKQMSYWQPGQQVNKGKFIVEKLLGGGGYGVTYKVRDINTNELFAIKTLNNQRQQQENFEELQYKFINEIVAIRI